MIKEEEQFYEKENLDVPKVPYFDNDIILGRCDILISMIMRNTEICIHIFYIIIFQRTDFFENKTNGVLSILSDECKMPKPCAEKFIRSLDCAKKGCENGCFTIQHFGRNVKYSAVGQKSSVFLMNAFQKLIFIEQKNFVENNIDTLPEKMLLITRDVLQKLGTDNIAVEQKATSFTLKHELNEIIANLQNNVSDCFCTVFVSKC